MVYYDRYGGTYDKNAGQMKFGASGPEAAPVATSAGRVMDIPAVSHWMEMPTYPNGHPKWPKDWSQAEKLRKLEVFPQGVLCRATLRLMMPISSVWGANRLSSR